MSATKLFKNEEQEKMYEKAIFNCCCYNEELFKYITTNDWRTLPLGIIEQFNKAYEKSKRDPKTGVIIKPHSMMNCIMMDPSQELKIGTAGYWMYDSVRPAYDLKVIFLNDKKEIINIFDKDNVKDNGIEIVHGGPFCGAKVTSIFDSIFTHANIKLSQIGPEVYEIIFAAISPEGKEYTLENLKLFNFHLYKNDKAQITIAPLEELRDRNTAVGFALKYKDGAWKIKDLEDDQEDYKELLETVKSKNLA